MRRHVVLKPLILSVTVCLGLSVYVGTRSATFAGSPQLSHQQLRSEGDQPFLPFAVWYGGGKVRAPMLEANPEKNRDAWRADLRQIKELGFNSVKCWVDWATAEPAPGEYDLRHVRQILELAQEVGLKVIVQVYIDSAPDWVGIQHPDGRFVSNSGYVVDSQSAPGFCFDHPAVQRSVLNFYSALAREVRNQPAFYGWDLWSEPHIINWASMRFLTAAEFCYCPNTAARFRAWLKAKYGTLEALNRGWYRRFTSWNQVQPPRFSTILSYTDYLDWRFFILDKLSEDLGMKAEAVLQEAPRGVVTSHAASPALFSSPLAGNANPDDWRMARTVQYWGTSSYPKHSSMIGEDVVSRGARFDFVRSAGYRYSNGFYLGEFQTGFGTVGLSVGIPVTPTDLTHWTWSALARGAKGLNFYAYYPMSSGYESGGFGLIYLDGRLTERAKVLGNIGKLVTSHSDEFLKARPPQAQVAVMYNPLAYMVGGARRQAAPGAQDEYSGAERDSWMGIYRALYYLNVPVDFVHAEDLAENGLSGYKLLYVPYPIMLSEGTGRAIARFIEQGGNVAIEARAAWNDERGYATPTIPGFGLDKVFGARETQVIPVSRTELVVGAKDAALPLLATGAALPGLVYQEALEALGPEARVVAQFRDGTPAAIASKHGRGQTLYLGSYLSMAYARSGNAELARFFEGLLDWAHVNRPVSVNAPQVEARFLEGPGYRLYFVFNNAEKEAPVEIRLRTPYTSPAVEDLVVGASVQTESAAGQMVLKKSLPSQGVWVLKVRESKN